MSSAAAIVSQGRGVLRILGLAFGVAAVVGNTVGVGIMRTSGLTAGRLGDPALSISSGCPDGAALPIQVLASAYLAIASSEFLAEIWPALARRETLLH